MTTSSHELEHRRRAADEELDAQWKIGQLAGEVGELRGAVRTGFAQLHGRIDGVLERLEDVAEAVHLERREVVRRIDLVRDELEDTDRHIIVTDERLDALERMQRERDAAVREAARAGAALARVRKWGRRLAWAAAVGACTVAGGLAVAAVAKACNVDVPTEIHVP